MFNSFSFSWSPVAHPIPSFLSRLTMYALDPIPKAFSSLYSDINLFVSKSTLSRSTSRSNGLQKPRRQATNKTHSHHRPPFSFIKTSGLQRSCIVRFPCLLPKKCLIDNRYPRLLIRQILDTLVPVTTNVLSCPPFEKIPFCSPISYSIVLHH